MSIIKQIVDWLNSTPTTRPPDLVAFEESANRVRQVSCNVEQKADELLKMAARIKRTRGARARPQRGRAVQ